METPAEATELRRAIGHYLQDRFELKLDPTHLGLNGTTLVALRKAFDLYFRIRMQPLNEWRAGTIVVARIGFAEPRVGHGCSLIELLKTHGRRLDFRYIGIEQANEECRAFAVKLGFHEHTDERNLLRSIVS